MPRISIDGVSVRYRLAGPTAHARPTLEDTEQQLAKRDLDMERFFTRWLMVASVMVAVVGAVLALATGTSALGLLEGPLLASIFGDTPLTPQMRVFRRWVFGVCGAVMLG